MRAVISTDRPRRGIARREGQGRAGPRRPRPRRRGRRDRAVPLGHRGAARLRAARRHRRPAGRSRATASSRSTPASSTTSCAGSSEAGCDVDRRAAARRPPRTSSRSSPTASSSRTARATRRRSTTSTRTLRELLGRKPVFGICLGHQMLSLAVGREDLQAQVRSPRRQPAGEEPAHRPGRDHEPEPRLLRRLRAASARSTPSESAGWTLDPATSARGSRAGVAPVVRSRALRAGAAHARQPQRHDRRGHPAARRPGVLGPVPPRGGARARTTRGTCSARSLGSWTAARTTFVGDSRARGEDTTMAISSMLVPVSRPTSATSRCCAYVCGLAVQSVRKRARRDRGRRLGHRGAGHRAESRPRPRASALRWPSRPKSCPHGDRVARRDRRHQASSARARAAGRRRRDLLRHRGQVGRRRAVLGLGLRGHRRARATFGR